MKVFGILFAVFLWLESTNCRSFGHKSDSAVKSIDNLNIMRNRKNRVKFESKVAGLSTIDEDKEPLNDNKASVVKARLNLLACTLLYGSNYMMTKSLQNSIQPEMINVFRFMIPFLYFIPTILRQKNGLGPLVAGLELGLLCAIGFTTQAIALQKSSTNKVAFFIGLGVIMPPIFDTIQSLYDLIKSLQNNHSIDQKLVNKAESTHSTHTGSERMLRSASKLKVPQATVPAPTHSIATSSTQQNLKLMLIRILKSVYISPLLAICGGTILEFTNTIEPPQLSDLLLLVTPLSFSLCFYRSSILSTNAHNANSTKFITAIMLLTTTIVSALYAYSCHQLPLQLTSWSTLLNTITSDYKVMAMLLYTSVVCTGWTALSEQKALKVLSAAETSLIYTLEPVFATLFGFLFLQEQITVSIFIGAVFIISACLYSTVIDFLL